MCERCERINARLERLTAEEREAAAVQIAATGREWAAAREADGTEGFALSVMPYAIAAAMEDEEAEVRSDATLAVIGTGYEMMAEAGFARLLMCNPITGAVFHDFGAPDPADAEAA